MAEIITLKQLPSIHKKLQKNQKKVVFTIGCFDILHYGHVQYFRYAKSLGDILVVGVDNDQNIRLNKGENRPFFTIDQRLQVLSELNSIDYLFEIPHKVTFVSDEADQMLNELLTLLQPNTFVSHSSGDQSLIRKKTLCQKLNIKLEIDRQPKDTSSTSIGHLIQSVDTL